MILITGRAGFVGSSIVIYLKKFKKSYLNWKFKYNLEKILTEIFDYQKKRI